MSPESDEGGYKKRHKDLVAWISLGLIKKPELLGELRAQLVQLYKASRGDPEAQSAIAQLDARNAYSSYFSQAAAIVSEGRSKTEAVEFLESELGRPLTKKEKRRVAKW